MDNMLNPQHNWINFKEKFLARRDGTRALAMAGYMRNQFEFLGIGASERQALSRDFLQETVREMSITQIHLMIRTLWQRKEREFQYLACDLLTKARRKWTVETFDLVEELICDKSWWDTVDTLAAHMVGPLAVQFPELVARVDAFAVHSNLWLRRSAIISQLQARQQTDFARLQRYCLSNAQSDNFFIRKAIGWALRTQARHDASGVQEFLTEHCGKFSNLSLQEALKHHRNLYAQLAHFGARSSNQEMEVQPMAAEPTPPNRPTLRPKTKTKPKRRTPLKTPLRRPSP